MPTLIATFAFLSVFLVFYGWSRRTPAVDIIESRLAHLAERGRPLSLAEAELNLPISQRVIQPFLNRLARAVTSRTPAHQQQALQERINLAGRPLGMNVGSYLLLRTVMPVVFAFLGYAGASALQMASPFPLVFTVVGALLGYLLPASLLSRRVRARQKEILLALPSALDLLTISVEAGLGFDAALARVVEKYDNALSLEFSQALNEVRLGRPRLEALDDAGRRTKVDELINFVQAIVQSEQLGVPIANVLRIQSEDIRRRRRQRAEEAGQKAPLKMLFPMVFCIFPTLFIVLLGPAALIVAKQFGGP